MPSRSDPADIRSGIHILVALPLNALLPIGERSIAPELSASQPTADTPEPPQSAIYLLAFVFAATWFCSTAMAAHLPRLLEAAGATTAMAIAAGALIGPAQVVARLAEYGFLQRFHPLVLARLAAAAHPVGAIVLMAVGGPAAYAFAILLARNSAAATDYFHIPAGRVVEIGTQVNI